MPSLTVSPSTVAPGAPFTAAGSGYGSGRNISLRINGAQVAYFTTGAIGSFSRALTAPAAVGNAEVTANSTIGCAAATLQVKAVVVEPPPSPIVGIYGPGIHMDGIGNTELGGTTNLGKRWYGAIARRAGTRIVAFRQQVPNVLPNYNGGTGGTVQYELRDATPTGPGNTRVGSYLPYQYPNTNDASGQRVGGIAPRLVTPGDWSPPDWFAICAHNIDANPTVNFTSIENIDISSVPDAQKLQPRFPDGQFQSFYTDAAGGSGGWIRRYPSGGRPGEPGMTAQLQVEWDNGLITGCGYVYRGVVFSGTKVERFTPKVDVPFTEVNVRTSGTTARVDIAGPDAFGFGSGTGLANGWKRIALAGTFRAGQTYDLSLTGSSNTIERGLAHGFAPSTVFMDGTVVGSTNQNLQWYVR